MKQRIVILHGTNYWNMGDLVLSIAMVDSLQRDLGDAEITLLSQFAGLERPHGQTFDIAQMGVEELPWLPRQKGASRLFRRATYLLRSLAIALYLLIYRYSGIRLSGLVLPADREGTRRLSEADLIISKAGGFIHATESRIPGSHNLLHIFLATLSGRPVVLYGQSIGPFLNPFAVRLARFVLNRTQMILVRDEPSLHVCNDILRLDSPAIHLTADEAFLHAGVPAQPTSLEELLPGLPDAPLVGMTILQWSFPGSPAPAESRRRYLDAMAQLVDFIHAQYGAHVVLIPFVYSLGSGRNDEEITQELARSVKDQSRVHLFRNPNPAAIQVVMQNLHVFVGSRMHSNIFALGTLVPVLAISYLPKTTGIMAMLGLDEFVLPIDTLTPLQLQHKFAQLWQNRDAVHAQLLTRIPQIQTRARKNVEQCRALLAKTQAATLRQNVDTTYSS